jgi:hypothetical protein
MHACMDACTCMLACLSSRRASRVGPPHACAERCLRCQQNAPGSAPSHAQQQNTPGRKHRWWSAGRGVETLELQAAHYSRGKRGGVPADPDPPQSSLSPRPSAPPALRISALSPQDLVLCRCRPPQREWWGSFPGIAAIARDKREGVPLILSQPQPQPQLRRAPSSMRVAGLEPTVFLWPFWPLAFGLGPEIAAPNQLSHSLCLHSAHFLPQADRRVGVCLLLVGGGRQAAISRSAGCKVFWQYGVNRPGTAGSRGRRSNQ